MSPCEPLRKDRVLRLGRPNSILSDEKLRKSRWKRNQRRSDDFAGAQKWPKFEATGTKGPRQFSIRRQRAAAAAAEGSLSLSSDVTGGKPGRQERNRCSHEPCPRHPIPNKFSPKILFQFQRYHFPDHSISSSRYSNICLARHNNSPNSSPRHSNSSISLAG